MKKITVVHMAEALGVGGMEMVISEIAEFINTEHYNVVICGIDKGGPSAEKLRNKGVDVRILGVKSYFNPINIIKLAIFLKEVRADIVHTHTYFSGVIGRVASKLAGIPVRIHHVHSCYWDYSQKNVTIEKHLSKITDRIICVSLAVKDFVVGHEGILSENVETVYNGIDPERYANVLSMGNSDSNVILSIGSLNEHKGHKVLVEAISLVRERGSSVRCVISGEGPERESLKSLIGQKGLSDYIELRGLSENVAQTLSEGDVFVMPSVEREGLGLAILEAMAAGKNVIASRVGGIPEVIEDGQNGLLVAPNDPEELARAMEKLFRDEDMRRKLSENARKTVKDRFTEKQMINKIECIYEECVSKKGLSR